MGHHERTDVHQLFDILRLENGFKNIVLWGRSMGAATILLSYSRLEKENLLAIVLDSPFSSVSRVYRNAVKKVITLPDVVIDMIYKYAKSQILDRYKFDLEEITPLECARKVTKPTAIIGTKEDKIVDYEDLHQMLQNVSCFKKKLFECPGSHIDDRPDDTIEDVIGFLNLVYEKKKELGMLVYVQRSNSIPKVNHDQHQNPRNSNTHNHSSRQDPSPQPQGTLIRNTNTFHNQANKNDSTQFSVFSKQNQTNKLSAVQTNLRRKTPEKTETQILGQDQSNASGKLKFSQQSSQSNHAGQFADSLNSAKSFNRFKMPSESLKSHRLKNSTYLAQNQPLEPHPNQKESGQQNTGSILNQSFEVYAASKERQESKFQNKHVFTKPPKNQSNTSSSFINDFITKHKTQDELDYEKGQSSQLHLVDFHNQPERSVSLNKVFSTHRTQNLSDFRAMNQSHKFIPKTNNPDGREMSRTNKLPVINNEESDSPAKILYDPNKYSSSKEIPFSVFSNMRQSNFLGGQLHQPAKVNSEQGINQASQAVQFRNQQTTQDTFAETTQENQEELSQKILNKNFVFGGGAKSRKRSTNGVNIHINKASVPDQGFQFKGENPANLFSKKEPEFQPVNQRLIQQTDVSITYPAEKYLTKNQNSMSGILKNFNFDSNEPVGTRQESNLQFGNSFQHSDKQQSQFQPHIFFKPQQQTREHSYTKSHKFATNSQQNNSFNLISNSKSPKRFPKSSLTNETYGNQPQNFIETYFSSGQPQKQNLPYQQSLTSNMIRGSIYIPQEHLHNVYSTEQKEFGGFNSEKQYLSHIPSQNLLQGYDNVAQRQPFNYSTDNYLSTTSDPSSQDLYRKINLNFQNKTQISHLVEPKSNNFLSGINFDDHRNHSPSKSQKPADTSFSRITKQYDAGREDLSYLHQPRNILAKKSEIEHDQQNSANGRVSMFYGGSFLLNSQKQTPNFNGPRNILQSALG